APWMGIATGALVRGSVRAEGEPAPAQNRRVAAAAPKALAAPPAQKSAPFVAKPVAKVEPRPVAQPLVAAAPAPRAQEPERRPPPPVLPSLGKGAKGKKKKDRDE